MNMLRTLLKRTILVTVVILLSGSCSRGAGGVRIGFLLKTMQEDRYTLDRDAFIQRAQAQGAEVLFRSSDNNEETEERHIEEMLDRKCRVIVFQPVNTATAGALVQRARDAGVKVVGYDTMLVNGPLDLMVMQDSWAVGRLQAEALVRWLKKTKGRATGGVVLIKGHPGDSNANAMSSGVLEMLRRNPGIRLIAERSHERWLPERAAETTAAFLKTHGTGVDAFICNNSGLCRGVITALDNAGRADSARVFTAGSDADLVNIRWIAQGRQTMEVWKKITPLAHAAADAALAMAKSPDADPSTLAPVNKIINNGWGDIPTVVTEVVAVEKDSLDATVIAGGFYTREQVYGVH